MRGSRRSWDLELKYHCTCESRSGTEYSVPLEWTGRPVAQWSAHVISEHADDFADAVLSGSSVPNSSSCRLGGWRTKSDTTGRCKRSQLRTKCCQTLGPLQSSTKTGRETNSTTNCHKSISKPTRSKPTLHRDMPDIPFNMEDLHSYGGLSNHSVHLEHYLSSYTYPQMEERLADSLSQEVCPACCDACGWVEDRGVWRRGRGGGEGQVRPSVVQVLMEDSALLKSSHSAPQRRTSHVLAPGAESSSHSNSHLPSLSYSTSTSRRGATNTTSSTQSSPAAENILEMAAYYRQMHQRHQDTEPNNRQPPLEHKYNSQRISFLGGRNSIRETSNSSHTLSQSVYEMGVRVTPESFPPLVVSSTNSFSHKPPTDPSTRARKKRFVRKRKTSSTESLATGLMVISSSSFHKDSTEFGNGHKTRGDDGKTAVISTKTLSPFQAVLPNVLRTSPREPRVTEKKLQASRSKQEQSLQSGDGDKRETKSHKRTGSRRMEDILFCKGMSTGTGERGGGTTVTAGRTRIK